MPSVMYSQPWSPTPSTTAFAPLFRTAKRSPARPAAKRLPPVAPLGQVANVLITQLSCDSNPESVSIQNFGGASQNLAGWAIRSDPVTNGGQVFDLSVVGTLDPGEQASIYSGSNAPATNVGTGVYRWALNFKFRNGDGSDFAQIVNGQTSLIDQLNCGQ